MMFKTMFSAASERGKNRSVFTEIGSPIKDEYQLRILDGQEELVKVGESNLYEYIQSHADSVDIHKILERCAMLDDYSLLNRMPSQFMDVTSMPKNLADAYAQVQDAKNFFDRMPTSIKEAYDNNYLQFIADIGSKKFTGVVSEFLDSIKPKDTEVKSDES